MGTGFNAGQIKSRAVDDETVSAGQDTGVRLRRYSTAVELEPDLLKQALRCAPQPMLIVDAFDRICFANDAAGLLLGQNPEALRTSFLGDHVQALDEQSPMSAVELCASATCTRLAALADGRSAQLTLTALRDRRGHVGFACATLEQAPSTAQVGPQRVLGAVARLAGQIAHDINNQLSAAVNYTSIVHRRLGGSEPLASHLEELQAALWRASGIANTLKVVGRTREPAAEPVQLGDVVRVLEPLLRLLARGVQVQTELADDLPEMNAPLAYVEQIVVGLALLMLARAPSDSALKLSTTLIVPEVEGAAPWARITLELLGEEQHRFARSASNGHAAHGTLRRAIKGCRARLGHDARRVWVDFH